MMVGEWNNAQARAGAEGKLQMLFCLLSLALLWNPIKDIFKNLNYMLYVSYIERKQALCIIHLKLPKGGLFCLCP